MSRNDVLRKNFSRTLFDRMTKPMMFSNIWGSFQTNILMLFHLNNTFCIGFNVCIAKKAQSSKKLPVLWHHKNSWGFFLDSNYEKLIIYRYQFLVFMWENDLFSSLSFSKYNFSWWKISLLGMLFHEPVAQRLPQNSLHFNLIKIYDWLLGSVPFEMSEMLLELAEVGHRLLTRKKGA